MDAEIYETKCVLIGEKSHESSVALNRENATQKSKNAEDCVSRELQSRKKM